MTIYMMVTDDRFELPLAVADNPKELAEMIGKNVIVLANLKPAVIRGVQSQGMLLAGQNGSEIVVAEVNGLVPGTVIS